MFAETKHNIGMGYGIRNSKFEMYPPNTEHRNHSYSIFFTSYGYIRCVLCILRMCKWLIRLLKKSIDLIMEFIYCKPAKLVTELSFARNSWTFWAFDFSEAWFRDQVLLIILFKFAQTFGQLMYTSYRYIERYELCGSYIFPFVSS